MSDEVETMGEKLWADADGEQALQQCRTLLASFADGIYQLNADGRFVAVDDGFAESVGYDRDDLLGEPFSMVLNDDDSDRVKEHIDALYDGREDEIDITVSLRTANGETIICEHRLTPDPKREESGNRGVVGAVRVHDNGDGLGLAPPDDTLAAVLDEAEVGVFILDAEFEVAWIDETIERYFGVDREDVVGRDKRQLIEETIVERIADGEAFRETVFATYDDNTYLERFECRVTPDDGREERWLEHLSKPIESGPYAGGRVELYYDVTEQRHSEDARRESEESFETLVDAVEEYAIFRLDPEGHVISWNEGAREIKGYDADEILGERFSTFYTEQDRMEGVPERNLERAAENGSVEDEGWRVREDGTQFWANVTITAIRDDNGTHRGYLKVTRDMTGRYEREQALKGELERVFDRISDAFYAVDENFRFTHVNDRAEELLQTSEEELLGEKLWDVFPSAAEIDDVRETFETALDEQEPTSYERYYAPLDFWVEANLYPSETGISVYFRDVTERVERQEQLRTRERALRETYEVIAEPDRPFREKVEDLLEEVRSTIGTDYATLSGVDKSANEYVFEAIAAPDDADLEAGDSVPLDATNCERVVRGRRTLVLADVEADAPELAGRADNAEWGISCYLGVPVIVGDDVYGTFCFYDMDARTKEFSDWEVTFVELLGQWVSYELERERYRQELEASNERLEQFAYVTSHDLQEPLRMVSSYLQMLERRYADELDEDAEEFIEFAVDGADRMREMIDGLLAYSRVETEGDPLKPVDLGTVLDDVLDDLRLSIEETDAEITVEDLPTVEGDASQLRQVFQNLLDNALEYSGDERPRITVTAERIGSEWIVSVEDEGVGIDPDDQERVFEVFQRLHTHDEHSGTGIGLALCERVVERHGGDIWAESEPGEGTTFSFTIPAAESHD